MPRPIADTPENVARAILTSPTKSPSGWRYLQESSPGCRPRKTRTNRAERRRAEREGRTGGELVNPMCPSGHPEMNFGRMRDGKNHTSVPVVDTPHHRGMILMRDNPAKSTLFTIRYNSHRIACCNVATLIRSGPFQVRIAPDLHFYNCRKSLYTGSASHSVSGAVAAMRVEPSAHWLAFLRLSSESTPIHRVFATAWASAPKSIAPTWRLRDRLHEPDRTPTRRGLNTGCAPARNKTRSLRRASTVTLRARFACSSAAARRSRRRHLRKVTGVIALFIDVSIRIPALIHSASHPPGYAPGLAPHRPCPGSLTGAFSGGLSDRGMFPPSPELFNSLVSVSHAALPASELQ